jgi:hypothetical protein
MLISWRGGNQYITLIYTRVFPDCNMLLQEGLFVTNLKENGTREVT